jgi:4-aminobutyrate aminotransferase-like enzyme
MRVDRARRDPDTWRLSRQRRRSLRPAVALKESAVIPAVMPVYARADVAFEKGEGAYLYDQDGRRYLDFSAWSRTPSPIRCSSAIPAPRPWSAASR